MGHSIYRAELTLTTARSMLWLVSQQAARYSIFIYGTMLPGEREHDLLDSAEFRERVTTAPVYELYEVGALAALVAGGRTAVVGELYSVSANLRFRLDVHREHPRLFVRQRIQLANGDSAEAYLMNRMQIRARRRVAGGDWKRRFSPPPTGMPPSPWRRWDQKKP